MSNIGRLLLPDPVNLGSHFRGVATVIAIIGQGISSCAFLFELFHQAKMQNVLLPRLTLFHIPGRKPACSWSSTAMVFPQGIDRRDGAWSATLVDAVLAFDHFVSQRRPEGVSALQHIALAAGTDEQKYLRRWKNAPQRLELAGREQRAIVESGHHVHVETFEQWINQQMLQWQRQGLLEIRDAEVLGFDGQHLQLAGQESIALKGSFWANSYGAITMAWDGAWSEWKNYLQACRPVSGSYCLWDQQWNPGIEKTYGQSLAIDLQGDHLILRPDVNALIMGSTTQDEKWAPDYSELEKIYTRFNELFPNHPLPPLEKSTVKTGMRLRGKAKRPWAKALDERLPGHLALVGTYKNGYSLPFYYAPALAKQALEQWRSV